MKASSRNSLPWWTWLAPLLVCFLGTLLALNFQITTYISMIYWPVALGLVMSIWWGPRVLLGVFFSAVLTDGMWQGADWQFAPLYALSDTLAVAAGWGLLVKVLRIQTHLPTIRDLLLFTLTSLGVVGLLKAGLTAALLTFLRSQTSDEFLAQSLLVWCAVGLDFLLVGMPLLVFANPWVERSGWSLSQGAQLPELLPNRPFKKQRQEAAALLIVLTISAVALPFYDNWIVFSLIFLWAVVRFGFIGVLLTNLVSQLLVVVLPVLFPTLFVLVQHPDPSNYIGIALNLIVLGYPIVGIGRMINNLFVEMTRRKNAEESLRKINRLNQALLEKSYEVISIISQDWKSLYVSPSIETVRGYKPSEVQHLNITQWIHPDDLPELQVKFQAILSKPGSTDTATLRVLHKDGHWIWAEIHGRNLCDDPDVGGIVVNYHDISESRRAQDLALRQRDLGQALTEIHNLDEGLALCLDTAIELTHMDSGGIYLFESDCQFLNLHISRGFGAEYIAAVRQFDANSPQVRGLLENKPIYEAHLRDSGDDSGRLHCEGCLCINTMPLIYMGRLLGCINLASHTLDEISPSGRTALESISAQMGAWILRLQAEEALQKSARNLEDSLQVGRMAYWEFDMSTRTLVLNDLFFQVLEISPQAIGGYRIPYESFVQHYIDPTVAQEFIPAVTQAVRSSAPGQQTRLETRLLLPNGRKFWAACWLRVENNSLGKPARIFGMLQDITAAKLTTEIQAARLRMVEYSETHSIAELCQMALDEVGHLTESPVGFYHFLLEDQKTLSLQAWSTRTLQEFCSTRANQRHYDVDAAGIWGDAIRQRHALIHNDYAALPQSQRKGLPDGHTQISRELVVPVFRQDQIVAILGVGNKPFDYNHEDVDLVTRLADLTWDITERKRTQLALQNSERKFREVVNASPNTVLVLQEDRYVFANPTALRMLGYTESELLEKNNLAIVHPNDQYALREQIKNVNDPQNNRSIELNILPKHGGTCLTESTATPILFNDFPATLLMLQDITARRRSEEDLKQRTMELGLLVISAGELSRSLDLHQIYGELYRFVTSAMPCTSIFISIYDAQDGLIRCASAWHAEGELDVSAFPPIPLEEEGKGTQSLVIRTGVPLLLNDYEAHFKTASVNMLVEADSSLVKDVPEDEDRPRSALIVPLKLENQVAGVIQVFSNQSQAYTTDNLWLLSALSNHAIIAMANSKLYAKAQNELEERRRAEEALRNLLDEKNALIKEIHHRVKNNMQVMISLLNLQSAQIADPKIRALFQESENRIRSMALVHEQLYRSSSLSQIDFGAYLESLTRDLHATFDLHGSVRLNLKLESLTLPIETAVPCGLIVNEMVTNAFKHAFPGKQGGNIAVHLYQQAGEIVISVSDDGVGIPPEIDVARLNSLGMKLIYLLANQVNGRIELNHIQGTKFRLYFKP
jgi:PAS domain S-box-containing protein